MLRPVTWQLSRRQKINPTAASGSLQPTFPMVVVGTWRGSWSPVTSAIEELKAGAPIVGIDIYAFLPAEAGSIIHEGDVLLRLEDVTRWEVARVAAFPMRAIAELKRSTEKKVAGA
jgi:hypothetical protein